MSEKDRLTLLPRFTTTSRLTVVKPVSATFSVCVPWSTLTKRNSPWLPLVVERVPKPPVRVTVAPGSTAPDSSITVP